MTWLWIKLLWFCCCHTVWFLCFWIFYSSVCFLSPPSLLIIAVLCFLGASLGSLCILFWRLVSRRAVFLLPSTVLLPSFLNTWIEFMCVILSLNLVSCVITLKSHWNSHFLLCVSLKSSLDKHMNLHKHLCSLTEWLWIISNHKC